MVGRTERVEGVFFFVEGGGGKVGLPLCKHFTYSVGAAVRWDHMSTNGTPS